MNYFRKTQTICTGTGANSLRGFTLVEVLVSMAIFVLAVSMGVLAVTTMDQASKRVRLKDQTIQSGYFLMDSISRSIRTGYNYVCLDSAGVALGTCPENSPTSASGAAGLQYMDQNNILRKILFDDDDNVVLYCITDTNGCNLAPFHSSNSLLVDDMNFYGSGIGVGDSTQPYITITAQFSYTFKGQSYPVPFQTSLTQRKLEPEI